MELPGSFSGMRDLADAGARARRPASARRWRSSSAQAARVFSAPWASTSASCAASASNLLGAVTKGSPVSCGDARRHALRVVRVRVEAGADRGAAQRQLEQVGQRVLDVGAGRGRAARRSRENSWPSVSGVASCRWVRPILTMSREGRRLCRQRVAQRGHAGESLAAQRLTPPRCAWRWETCRSTTGPCSRRRWDARAAPRRARRRGARWRGWRAPRCTFMLRLGAGARLPDHQRELLVVLSGEHLVRRGHDRLRLLRRRARPARGSRAPPPSSPAPAHGSARAACARRRSEVLQRSLRLRAPEPIGRDLDGAEGVLLDASLHGLLSEG